MIRNGRLVNFRTAVFLAVFQIVGILSSYYAVLVGYAVVLSVDFIVITVSSVLLFGFLPKRKFAVIVTALSLVLFLFGFFCTEFKKITIKDAYFSPSECEFTGTVKSCSPSEKGYRITLANVTVKTETTVKIINGYIYSTVPYDVGDTLQGYGDATCVDFDFYSLSSLLNEGAIATFTPYSITVTNRNPNLFQRISNSVKRVLSTNMDKDSYPVAFALLTGRTDDMNYDVLTSYRMGGIAHIFAVSGLHIGFMCSIITLLIKPLKIRKRLKTLITVLLLTFYAGICGFKPSSLRAVIVYALASVYKNNGYKFDMLSALAISSIFVLIVDVGNLFDVGFVLSYVTILSVVTLAPKFKRSMKKLPVALSDALALSLSSNVGVLPLCLFCFGYFSPSGLITNILFIPFACIMYYIVFAFAVITLTVNSFGVILIAPSMAIKLLNGLFTTVDFKFLTLTLETPLKVAISYYFGVLVYGETVNVKRGVKTAVACISAILSVVFCFI